jgi:hypothetical protein
MPPTARPGNGIFSQRFAAPANNSGSFSSQLDTTLAEATQIIIILINRRNVAGDVLGRTIAKTEGAAPREMEPASLNTKKQMRKNFRGSK